MGNENLNMFEINELCVFVEVTCDEPCEVFPKVKEEEEMYKDISRIQDQNCIMMNSDSMLSHEDNLEEHSHIFDNMIVYRHEEEFVVASRRILDCKYN